MHEEVSDPVTERVLDARSGLAALLSEADRARRARAEASGGDGTERDGDGTGRSGAVCAWNHFENIPTFYNWNNRPR
jgi:hypothetical protein